MKFLFMGLSIGFLINAVFVNILPYHSTININVYLISAVVFAILSAGLHISDAIKLKK